VFSQDNEGSCRTLWKKWARGNAIEWAGPARLGLRALYLAEAIVRAHSNGRDGPPPSRWIVGRMREWSDEEGEALTAEMERRIASNRSAADQPISPHTQRMTDAELLAAGMGERLS
jgi:hypothetical protein